MVWYIISIHIRIMMYALQYFCISGIIIFGRGGYDNAQPAKSYLGVVLLWQRHFQGIASLRHLSFLPPVLR